MGPFGGNVQLFDWAGKPTSATTDSAAVTNRPGAALYQTTGGSPNQAGFVALGSDYATPPKAQVPKVDANGAVYIASANTAAAGQSTSSPAGPIVMGLYGQIARPLQMDALQNLVVAHDVLPTFSAIAAGVSLSTGKSVLALVNGSSTGTVLRLIACYAINSSTTTTGLNNYNIYAAELRPITGVAATGTSVACVPHDSSDTLDANVKAYTAATVTGDTVGPLRRWVTSSYGLTPNSTNAEGQNAEQQGRLPWVFDFGASSKPVVVRPGAGLHLKIATTVNTGFLDTTFIFTSAPA